MKKHLTNNPCVYVISGVRNDWKLTKRMLNCFAKQDYKNLKIIIIDDASTDNTTSQIKEKYPYVHIIKGGGNLWWTGAMYAGVEHVLANCEDDDMILTMNNDCEFKSDYVRKLVIFSKKTERSIVGSIAIDSIDKDKIIDAGVRIDWSRGKVYRIGPRSIKEFDGKKDFEEDIDTLPTKGTLYPVEVFKKVGNFNKNRLPHYVSDYEMACRAKRSGFKLIICYKTAVYNVSSRTGLLGILDKPITPRELNRLLFSKKSQINIIDHFNFIDLCCPGRFKFFNYLLLLGKLLYLSSHIYPFWYIRKPIVELRKKILDI